MRVLLAILDGDALPAQLLHGDERLMNVSVLVHQEGPKVKGETFRMEDVWGGLGHICGTLSGVALRWSRGGMNVQ